MTRLLHRPAWRDCLAIIRQEAIKFEVDPDDVVMCQSRTSDVMAARRSAVRRILADLKCSQRGLASVWGISLEMIRGSLAEIGAKRSYEKRSPTLHQARAIDEATERFHERLRWAHGDARAAQIIAGQDPATNRDMAAWKSLGARGNRSQGRGNA